MIRIKTMLLVLLLLTAVAGLAYAADPPEPLGEVTVPKPDLSGIVRNESMP